MQGQDVSTAAERNIEKKYFIVDGEQIEKKKKRVFLNGFHLENNSFIYYIVASMWSETFPPKNLALFNHKNFVGIKLMINLTLNDLNTIKFS